MSSLNAFRCILSFYPQTPTAVKILRPPRSDDVQECDNDDPVKRPSYAISAAAPVLRLITEQMCGFEAVDLDMVRVSRDTLCRYDTFVSAYHLCNADVNVDDDDEDEAWQAGIGEAPQIKALRKRHSHLSHVADEVYDPTEFFQTRWIVCKDTGVLAAVAWWLMRPLGSGEKSEGSEHGQLHVAAIHLSLNHLYTAVDFDGLGIAAAVRSLHIMGRQSDLSAVKQCRSLRSIRFENCHSKLEDVMADLVTHTPELTSVWMMDSVLSDVSWVRALQHLCRIALPACVSLVDASALAGCPTLLSVDVSFCECLENVQFIAALPQLSVLNLQETPNHFMDGLGIGEQVVASLRVLCITDCGWVNQVTDPGWFGTLRHVEVVLGGGTDVNAWLPNVPLATVLDLSYSTDLTDPAPLAALESLRVLILNHCSNISSIEPILLNCPLLESIDVSGCFELASLFYDAPEPGAVRSAKRLHTIHARRSGLEDLSHINELTQLVFLDVSNTAMEDLSALAGMPRLKYVYAEGAPISDVDFAASCPRLRVIAWGDE